MSDTLKMLLDPATTQIATRDLMLVIGVCAPLCLGGMLGMWRLIKRLGKAGGSITLESFLLGVPLALAALMLPDLLLYLVFRDAYTQNRSSFALPYGLLQVVTTGSCIAALRLHPWELKGAPLREWARLDWPAQAKTIGVWMLAVPVIICSMMLAVALARAWGWPIEQQTVLTDLTRDKKALRVMGAYAMAAFGVPLAEEFAFRLVLFGGLRGLIAGREEKGPAVALAFVLSIALFVFAHGVWRPEQFYLALPLTMLSILLTLVYQQTRSIWTCVMFHALHNSLVLTLQFTLTP